MRRKKKKPSFFSKKGAFSAIGFYSQFMSLSIPFLSVFVFGFALQTILLSLLAVVWVNVGISFKTKRIFGTRLSKKALTKLGIYTLILSFLIFYQLYFFGSIRIIFAATPTPNPPSVSDSPDPQVGGSSVTFSCPTCSSGAANEHMRLLICRSNSAECIMRSQWGYRRPITISNSGSAQTDYQVLVINPIYNEAGLVGSWHLDEGSGTVARDSSGNVNTGAIHGATWTTAGRFGNALSFDGVDDNVTTTIQFSNPQTFSIVVWFRTTSTSGRKIVGFENTQTGIGSTTYDRHLYVGTDGRLYFGIYDGSVRVISTSGTVNDGNWHFAVATFASNTMRLYFDGSFVGSLSTGAAQNYNGWWRIGSYKLSGWANGGDGFFPGTIDEVRIYNRNLTDSEIQALYQAKAKLNYDDVRFIDSDGSLLNYWMEADGRFWVRVPSVPAGSKTIYIYYGNPDARSASDASNTFDYYDAGSPVGWTIAGTSGQTSVDGNPPPSLYANSSSGSYMYKNIGLVPSRIITFNVKSNRLGNFFFLTNSSGAGQMYRLDTRGGTNYAGFNTTSSWTSWNPPASGFTALANTWYKFGIVINSSTSATLYYQQTTDSTPNLPNTMLGAYTISNRGGHIGLVGDTGGASFWTLWDNIFVRKFASPEPTTSVGTEETNIPSTYIWSQSSLVINNPSASYVCPSCGYSVNTYYGVSFNVNQTVWTSFTSALTFTCKKQEGCSPCTNVECYNYCWPAEDGMCYNNACIKTLERPGTSNPACVAGSIVAHDNIDSSQRYLTFNGELYYCKISGGAGSGYDFVQDVNPGSVVSSWKCGADGIWRGGTGVIGIRGGRIRIA